VQVLLGMTNTSSKRPPFTTLARRLEAGTGRLEDLLTSFLGDQSGQGDQPGADRFGISPTITQSADGWGKCGGGSAWFYVARSQRSLKAGWGRKTGCLVGAAAAG
jgi:hypothetical protein